MECKRLAATSRSVESERQRMIEWMSRSHRKRKPSTKQGVERGKWPSWPGEMSRAAFRLESIRHEARKQGIVWAMLILDLV